MENSSKPVAGTSKPRRASRWWWVLILPVWTYGAFMLAQFIIALLHELLVGAGVPLEELNQVMYGTVIAAAAYSLAVVLAVGAPLVLFKRRTSKKEMGVQKWPAWLDVLLPVPAYFGYFICSMIAMLIVSTSTGLIDPTQQQQLPFSPEFITGNWQYILVFLTLVVLAPLAEELLFRGYLYGKLRKLGPAWVAMIVSGVAFGLAHLWAGPGTALQWAVMVDTMVLGFVLALLREWTGAVWASVLLHAFKNGIAFYLLFINPDIINQLQAALVPLLGLGG